MLFQTAVPEPALMQANKVLLVVLNHRDPAKKPSSVSSLAVGSLAELYGASLRRFKKFSLRYPPPSPLGESSVIVTPFCVSQPGMTCPFLRLNETYRRATAPALQNCDDPKILPASRSVRLEELPYVLRLKNPPGSAANVSERLVTISSKWLISKCFLPTFKKISKKFLSSLKFHNCESLSPLACLTCLPNGCDSTYTKQTATDGGGIETV
ncbi:MAG: hypothetical protein K8T91_25310 [Planctomycetes bacterium]|nr:hypothetical protein [Planctomycetota bacterium]